MKLNSIKSKIFLTLGITVNLLLAGILWQVYSSVHSNFTKYIDGQIYTKSNMMRLEVKDKHDIAYMASELVSQDIALLEALERNDREFALQHGQMILRALQVDYLVITDSEAKVFIRAHEPDRFGDNIGNQINIQRALKGERSAGFEDGKVVKFSIRAGAPLYNAAGEIIGALSMGFVLGYETFVDETKTRLGIEASLFYGDRVWQSTISDETGKRIVGMQLSDSAIANKVLIRGEQHFATVNVAGLDLIGAFQPVQGADGAIIGMLFCGEHAEVLDSVSRAISLRVLIVMAILSLVTIGALALVINHTTARPLTHLAGAAAEFAQGKLSTTFRINSNDEVGRLAAALAHMANVLRDMVQRIH